MDPGERGGDLEDLGGGLRLAALSTKIDQPDFRVPSRSRAAGGNRLKRDRWERLHSDHSMCDHPETNHKSKI